MKTVLTSVTAIAALVMGVGAASACDWSVQAMAYTAPASAETSQPAEASRIDPRLLAWLKQKQAESTETTAAVQ